MGANLDLAALRKLAAAYEEALYATAVEFRFATFGKASVELFGNIVPAGQAALRCGAMLAAEGITPCLAVVLTVDTCHGIGFAVGIVAVPAYCMPANPQEHDGSGFAVYHKGRIAKAVVADSIGVVVALNDEASGSPFGAFLVSDTLYLVNTSVTDIRTAWTVVVDSQNPAVPECCNGRDAVWLGIVMEPQVLILALLVSIVDNSPVIRRILPDFSQFVAVQLPCLSNSYLLACRLVFGKAYLDILACIPGLERDLPCLVGTLDIKHT